MLIYNSLTRKKEELAAQKDKVINLYSCGVTVYDDCHIGHARSLYIFSVIRNYLRFRGFQVNFVRNITDIDDKIINRANELKMNWQELVDKYIVRYYEDMAATGIEKADLEPRATENIPDMIEHIKGLIANGTAYETDSGVYFSVRKFKDYGKLSGQSIEQMLTGVRKEADESKQDPLDFALWKKSKPNEPAWDSPWGPGRPGWHIECSVMSTKFLKTQTIDIHAGGRDLIFPHHENEIAQAEALTGKQFAKYWIHHGLLTINGQKMSKSLGNFVTIKDFLAKYRHPELLKLFFLSAHYSHPIDYTDAKIEEARQALKRIVELADNLGGGSHAGKAKEDPELIAMRSDFAAAMDDDFNMPQALAKIFELVSVMNKRLHDKDFIAQAWVLLKELTKLFGLDISGLQTSLTNDPQDGGIEELIKERLEAKKRKDFSEADRLRMELEAKGIILKDTKDGTTWRRKI